MSELSLEEFINLKENEKCKRYKDLSDHDKFLVRINQSISPTVIPDKKITEEQRKKIKKMKEDTKTLEEMEKFAEKHIAKLKKMRKEKGKAL